MLAIEERIRHTQELISKGNIYRIMNFNLFILKMAFRKGRGQFSKLSASEIENYKEDFNFIA
jgi:hypothetical protein